MFLLPFGSFSRCDSRVAAIVPAVTKSLRVVRLKPDKVRWARPPVHLRVEEEGELPLLDVAPILVVLCRGPVEQGERERTVEEAWGMRLVHVPARTAVCVPIMPVSASCRLE
jgi:hypothetical protein